MNTPAHILISLGVLGHHVRPKMASAIILGSFIPDLPAFIFYFYEKIILGTAESIIWAEKYFQANWNYVFDIFHSIPLSLFAIGVCLLWKKPCGYYFFLAVLLHCLIDLSVHHSDAHRHFLPFIDYKFISPISYWESRYYGQYIMGFEILASLFLSIRYLSGLKARYLHHVIYFILAVYTANIAMGFYYW